MNKKRIYNKIIILSIGLFFLIPFSSVKASFMNVSPKLPLNTGLVGWWTFDGKDIINGVVRDASRNGNDGNLYGIPSIATSTFYVPGIIGQAGNFDDVNENYLDAGSNAPFDSNNWTMSIWVNPLNVVAGGYQDIFSYYGDGPTIEKAVGSGSLSIVHLGGIDFTANITLVDNKWQHVTFTRSGSTIVAYLNGVQTAINSSFSATFSKTQTVRVGGSAASPYTFAGKLDEARIYNRALSASEVKQLYNAGVSTYKNPLTSGLLGWWNFDDKEMSNGVVPDKSGNNNKGNLFNIASSTFFTSGKLGQSFNFDGLNDYVDMGSSIPFDSSNWTMSVWVNPSNVAGGYQRLFSYYGNGPTIWKWAGAGSFGIVHGASIDFDSGVILVNDRWQHLTFTRSGSTIVAYLNGVQWARNNAFSATFTKDTTVRIGNSTAYNEPFAGKLDEPRIYNRALSATEVKNLYNLGTAKFGISVPTSKPTTGIWSGLVGHWTFDGNDMVNGVVSDKSGNNNSGNLINIASSTFYTIGKIGQAGNFDGADDYVDTNYVLPTTNFSFGIWAQSSSGAQANRIMGNADYSSGTSGIDITYGYGNGIRVVARRGANVGTWDLQSDALTPGIFNGWHHVFVTLDSINGLKIYYDGSLIASKPTTLLITSSFTTKIGRTGNGGAYIGKIDDARIYNRVLSDTEVKQLYNLGR